MFLKESVNVLTNSMRECLNNMKKYRIVAVFVMILLMGCGSAQNGKMKESSTMKKKVRKQFQ